jgi:hypothetical protein
MIEVDQNQGAGVQKLSLAEGLWRVFDRAIKRRGSEALHSQSKGTSPANHISG